MNLGGACKYFGRADLSPSEFIGVMIRLKLRYKLHVLLQNLQQVQFPTPPEEQAFLHPTPILFCPRHMSSDAIAASEHRLLPSFSPSSSLSEIIIDQTLAAHSLISCQKYQKLSSRASISNPNLAVVHASPLFLYLPMFGEQNQMFTCFCKQTEIMSGKEQTLRHGFITMRYDFTQKLC